MCIPVVSSTPPSSPSSPGAIPTKQRPALSPLPSSPVHFLQSERICGSGISLNSPDEGASGGDWGRNIGEKQGWIKQTRGGGFTQLASSCMLSRRSEKGCVYKQLGAQPPTLGERLRFVIVEGTSSGLHQHCWIAHNCTRLPFLILFVFSPLLAFLHRRVLAVTPVAKCTSRSCESFPVSIVPGILLELYSAH